VNSYDDVATGKSTSGGSTSTTGGTATSGGANSSGGANTTGGMGTSGGNGTGGRAEGGAPTDAGAGGDPGSTGGVAGAGGSGGEAEAGAGGDPGTVRPTPTKGLIVLGGTNLAATGNLISVLNPVSGAELRREALPANTAVAGIAYDGAPGKDVWFVFVGSDFPAKPDKVVNLQVRYFNDRTNNWIILSRATTLPPPVPGTFAVLNDRLAYLSHEVIGGVVKPSLTILDTSDVRDVSVVTYQPPALPGEMLLLLGTRGTADDRSGLGGTLDLGLGQNCSATTCDLFVQPISVGSTVTTGVGHAIGKYRGTPVAAASARQLSAYFAFAPATGSVVVSQIAPDAPEAPTTSNAPPMATDLSALTLAECQKVVVFTAYAENALYGVTGAGIGKTLDLGRPGQLVAYEPFTRETVTTYNPPDNSFSMGGAGGGGSGPEISSVVVTSPSTSSLTLALRNGAAWAPPDDVRVNAMATRVPYPLECP
jgi:hypothetical protein